MFNNACANTGLSIALADNFTATVKNINLAAAFIFTLLSTFTIAANALIITSLLLSPIKNHGDGCAVNVSIVKSLIVSMAVSDAIIGIFSMPLAIYELFMNGHWALGQNLCDIKLLFDVFLCTVSIYHVACMAVDRYLAVCRPMTYRTLTINTGYCMIGISWCIPASLGGVLLLGDWHTEGFQDIVRCFQLNSYCSMVFNMQFQVTLAMISFYFPMVAMCGLYFLIGRKIWLISLKHSTKNLRNSIFRLRRNVYSNKQIQPGDSTHSLNEINGKLLGKGAEGQINNTTPHVKSTSSQSTQRTMFSERSGPTEPDLGEEREQTDIHGGDDDASRRIQDSTSAIRFDNKFPVEELATKKSSSIGLILDTHEKNAQRLPQQELSSAHGSRQRIKGGFRNMKTVRTISSVVVCFTFCWMPFSVYVVIQSYYMYALPLWPYVLLSWLGYLNSALNPIIYCGNRSIRQTVKSFVCPLKT